MSNAVNWEKMYDAVYANLGDPADLTPASGGAAVSVTVIDKTEGVEIDAGPIVIPTIMPAVMIRMAELISKNLTLPDLKDGTLLLFGKAWTIKVAKPQRRPPGSKGEVLLVLIDGTI